MRRSRRLKYEKRLAVGVTVLLLGSWIATALGVSLDLDGGNKWSIWCSRGEWKFWYDAEPQRRWWPLALCSAWREYSHADQWSVWRRMNWNWPRYVDDWGMPISA